MSIINPIAVRTRLALLLASGAALVGVTAYAQGGGNPRGQKMANVPGPVTASPAGSAMLTGHFEIRTALPGEPGIF
jgi:hypothetical protein